MSNEPISGLRERERRRRRVNRIKKVIIGLISFWMIFSLTAIVILTISITAANKRIDNVEQHNQADATGNSDSKKNDVDNNIDDNIGEDYEPTDDPIDDTGEDEPIDENAIKVYLTFDDGPSENTEKILDILKEYDVKATFFVIGKTDDYSKELYKRIVDEGHTIALHSYSHRYSSIYKSVEDYAKDLQKISDVVFDATGVRCKFIRFPGGSSNTVSAVSMKDIIKYVTEQGYVYFDWNVVNGDATAKNYTVDQLVDNVMNDVGKYQTNVVLMHDARAKTSTVEALPTIIEKILEKGYVILPIDDNTTPIQHIKVESVVTQ